MLRSLLVAGFVLLFASAAVGNSITVYGDASGASCSIADVSPALFTVFVIHNAVDGSVGSNLRVTESSGFAATFVGENNAFYHDGTFRDGVNVFYAECLFSTFVIGTITYQGHGTSETCSTLETTGNPNWVEGFTPDPITSDCTFQWYPAPSAMSLHINPSVECPAPCAVKSQSSTWGRVKALYRH